jgi:hypothetical protein
MFKKYSAIFLIVVLMLNLTYENTLVLSPLEKSLLPDHSLREILISLREEARNADPFSPRSFKGLIEKIKKMMTDLQEEQRASRDIHEKMKKQCTEEISFRDVQVDDAHTSISRSSEAKQLCDVSAKASLSDKDQIQDAIETYNFHLKRAQAQRDHEHKLYLERKSELEEGLSFVKGFNKYLKKTFSVGGTNSTSLIDMSEELLRHASNAGALSETIPILISISAVTTGDNDSDLTQKLMSTIISLETRLKGNWEANEKAEIASLQTFSKYSSQIKKTVGKLQDTLKIVNEEVTDMAKCVKQEDKINKWALNKLLRNENLRKSSSDMCKKFDQQYVEATKNKLEEISLIREILDIINMRFKNVPIDLQLYLEETEKSWKEYINSTEFKQFVEYKQKKIENSEHGEKIAKMEVTVEHHEHKETHVHHEVNVVVSHPAKIPQVMVDPVPKTHVEHHVVITPPPQVIAPAPKHLSARVKIAPAPQPKAAPVVIAPAPQHLSAPVVIAPAPQHLSAPVVIAPAPKHLSARVKIAPAPQPKTSLNVQEIQSATATLLEKSKKFLH